MLSVCVCDFRDLSEVFTSSSLFQTVADAISRRTDDDIFQMLQLGVWTQLAGIAIVDRLFVCLLVGGAKMLCEWLSF